MNRPLLFILTFIVFFLSTNSQAQSWRWGRNGGSNDDSAGIMIYTEAARDICTDAHGNIYSLCMAGQTNLHFGSQQLSSWGGTDIILVSYRCDGSIRWIKQIGGAGNDEAIALKADATDGIYIAGQLQAYNTDIHIDLDTSWNAVPTYKKLLFVKYDTSGNYKWSKMPEPDTVGNNSANLLLDIDVDANGEVFCLSALEPGLYNNAYTTMGGGIFILHYMPDGTFLNGTQLDASYTDMDGSAMCLTRDFSLGRYYITEGTKGIGGIAGLHFGSYAIDNSLFIGAFRNSGELIWAKSGSGAYAGAFVRPALDDAHNIYLGGTASNLDTFNGYYFSNAISSDPIGMPIIIKMDTNGNNQWIKVGATNSAANIQSIVCKETVVTISGAYTNRLVFPGEDSANGTNAPNLYTASLSKATGNLLKFDTLRYNYTTPCWAFPTCMTSDKLGNFYIGGYLEGHCYAGNDTLSTENVDILTVKYGYDNCSCTEAPVANFDLLANLEEVTCTYTGTMNGIDSIVWHFGDGSTATGSTCNHSYMNTGLFEVCATAYSSCGNNTYCALADIGVGVKNISGFAGVQIYPNPALNTLFISNAPTGTIVTLFNLIGQVAYRGLISDSQYAINTSTVTPGTYLVQLTNSKGNSATITVVRE